MMTMRATVRQTTGMTKPLIGDIESNALNVRALPDPAYIEIVEQDGEFFLLRFDNDGRCIADTWHESMGDAKTQANFEYGVVDDDWFDATSA